MLRPSHDVFSAIHIELLKFTKSLISCKGTEKERKTQNASAGFFQIVAAHTDIKNPPRLGD